jgi:hypothetical protein
MIRLHAPRCVMATVMVLGSAIAHAATLTFDVNDGGAWTTGTGAGANSSVTYGFDYSSLGIPQAPGSSTTTAVVLRSNTNSGAAAAQGITISPNGLSLAGDYVIRAMIWGNSVGGWTTAGAVSSGTGSSQMVGLGVGYGGGTLWRGGATTGGGSGVWFATCIEGGFSAASTTVRDYSAFVGSGASVANFITATSSVYPNAFYAGSGTNAQDNFNSYYTAAFPSRLVNDINSGTWATTQNQTLLTGTLTAGIPGMAWREYSIARSGSTVTWSIDATPIATLSGTALTLDGPTSLTYFDPTSGVANPQGLVFGLVSSYVVETVPEPTTIGLLAAAAAGAMPLLSWRRRRA